MDRRSGHAPVRRSAFRHGLTNLLERRLDSVKPRLVAPLSRYTTLFSATITSTTPRREWPVSVVQAPPILLRGNMRSDSRDASCKLRLFSLSSCRRIHPLPLRPAARNRSEE